MSDSQISTFCSGPLETYTVEEKGQKQYFVEGYMSTGDLDLVNDIVTDNCMKSMLEQLNSRNIKLDFQHETMRGDNITDRQIKKTTIPLGKNVKAWIDEKGLRHKTELNPNWVKLDSKGNVTMTFEQVWGSVKDKFLDGFSIAYTPTKVAYQNRQGKSVRMLDDLVLWTYALTGNAINPEADMTAAFAKSLDAMESKSSNEGGNLTEEETIVEDTTLEVQEPEVKEMQEQINDLKATIDTLQEKAKDSLKEEVKSILDEMSEEDLKSLITKHNQTDESELKDVMDKVSALEKTVGEQKSIIEAARVKATGPEDKSGAGQFDPAGDAVGSAPKGAGPLSWI